MIFNPKTYHRPQNLEEAVSLMARTGAVAAAGGAMIFNRAGIYYESFVDLQDLADLKRIEQREGSLFIGGCASLQAVIDSALVPDVLKQAVARSVPLNIRNGASVGECLLAADPLPEWLAALVALDAYIEHAGQDDQPGQLSLWDQPIDEFIEFVHKHGHPYQGVVYGLHLPRQQQRTLFGTALVARTPADMPIVNVVVKVTVDDAGLVSGGAAAVGGASDAPVMRLALNELAGGRLSESDIQQAAQQVETKAQYVADYRGSYEYRVEMAKTLLRRALLECVAQLA